MGSLEKRFSLFSMLSFFYIMTRFKIGTGFNACMFFASLGLQNVTFGLIFLSFWWLTAEIDLRASISVYKWFLRLVSISFVSFLFSRFFLLFPVWRCELSVFLRSIGEGVKGFDLWTFSNTTRGCFPVGLVAESFLGALRTWRVD